MTKIGFLYSSGFHQNAELTSPILCNSRKRLSWPILCIFEFSSSMIYKSYLLSGLGFLFHEPFSLLDDYSLLAPTQEPRFSLWHSQYPPSLCLICSSNEKEEPDFIVKSCKGQHLNNTPLVLIQVELGVVNSKEFGGIYEHKRIHENSSNHDWIPPKTELNTRTKTKLIAFSGDTNMYSVQGVIFNSSEMQQHSNECAASLTHL
ncbi:hypothetical protein KSP39_PZI017829 [Platanthera zijinensis]|uniref:Uncharacterized protein n=1 Tax=Platanthera zijinensis TaxID=2320716 RepID=A0AAP0B4X9_9ASPA